MHGEYVRFATHLYRLRIPNAGSLGKHRRVGLGHNCVKRKTRSASMLKFFGGSVGVSFIIGLIVGIGVFPLIF